MEAESVPRRALGSQGLRVPPLGLGCMGMSEYFGPKDQDEAVATILRSLDLGFTFLDTSDAYGPETNERLVGGAIRGRRDEVILATKFGSTRDAGGTRGVRGDAAYVKQACEASLTRLGVDHIDLYYQHRVDKTVEIEETVSAMAELVAEGKVRYLGLSEASERTIRRAHAVHPITAVQLEFSLWTREPSTGIIPVLRELGIGTVAYRPLGAGFFTGTVTTLDGLVEKDFRRSNPRFRDGNLEQNLDRLHGIERIARDNGVTPAQLALAWILAQGQDIVAIPGSDRRVHLEENVAAAAVVLSEEDLARIDEVFPVGAAAGDRLADYSRIDL
ncbi:aldo/keto reductase [Microbacterium sp. BWT-B31]|uniref:aldo/keto reductase n=1 Tax=Microbacterium sp. BWT-B31 TaxID=3232072 RepID=UPI0035283C61